MKTKLERECGPLQRINFVSRQGPDPRKPFRFRGWGYSFDCVTVENKIDAFSYLPLRVREFLLKMEQECFPNHWTALHFKLRKTKFVSGKIIKKWEIFAVGINNNGSSVWYRRTPHADITVYEKLYHKGVPMKGDVKKLIREITEFTHGA